MALVDRRFDFRVMSQLTLGREWLELSATGQDRFVTLFAALLKNTYISKVESYSGERVVFARQVVRDDKAMAFSAIIKDGGEIPVAYKMIHEGGDWLVYAVMIEGVSLARNYRTQFSAILAREKFSGLVARMESKIGNGEI